MPGISLLIKNVTKLLHPPDVDCSPSPWAFMGNPGDGEKSYTAAKNLLISPIRKIPLNRFKSFTIKSFISSLSNSNFQVIILCNLHLQLESLLLHHILNLWTLLMLIWLNVYWMLPLAWQKHQIFQSLPIKVSIPPSHLSIPSLPPMLFQKPCFYYCLFSSFSHSLFYIKKFLLDFTPIGNFWLCGLIKYI